MKELKRTKTIEETYGYEAFDGTFFRTEESCREYESSANATIRHMAYDLLVKPKVCVDSVLPLYCGDDNAMVWDIKDADHLRIVNQFLSHIDSRKALGAEYIGKRVCVVVGYDEGWFYILGTRDEVLAEYTKDIDRLFADPKDTSTSA